MTFLDRSHSHGVWGGLGAVLQVCVEHAQGIIAVSADAGVAQVAASFKRGSGLAARIGSGALVPAGLPSVAAVFAVTVEAVRGADCVVRAASNVAEVVSSLIGWERDAIYGAASEDCIRVSRYITSSAFRVVETCQRHDQNLDCVFKFSEPMEDGLPGLSAGRETATPRREARVKSSMVDDGEVYCNGVGQV